VVTVLGFRNGRAFAVRRDGEVRSVGRDDRLLPRSAAVGLARAVLCDGDDGVIVSLRLDRFARTGVRAGDEVGLDGAPAAVAGICDRYRWFVRRGGGIRCVALQDWQADRDGSVVRRLAADLSELYAVVRSPYVIDCRSRRSSRRRHR
jgi:hypothetical protein